MRPGRFDRIIAVPLPDIRGRAQILKHHMKGVITGKGASLSRLIPGSIVRNFQMWIPKFLHGALLASQELTCRTWSSKASYVLDVLLFTSFLLVKRLSRRPRNTQLRCRLNTLNGPKFVTVSFAHLSRLTMPRIVFSWARRARAATSTRRINWPRRIMRFGRRRSTECTLIIFDRADTRSWHFTRKVRCRCTK